MMESSHGRIMCSKYMANYLAYFITRNHAKPDCWHYSYRNCIGFYTAMAGTVVVDLGDLAIRYGYQRFQTDVMLITVVLMVVMVQVIQVVGDFLVRILRK